MIVWNILYKGYEAFGICDGCTGFVLYQHEESILYLSYQHQGEEAPGKTSFKRNYFKEFVEINCKLFYHDRMSSFERVLMKPFKVGICGDIVSET